MTNSDSFVGTKWRLKDKRKDRRLNKGTRQKYLHGRPYTKF